MFEGIVCIGAEHAVCVKVNNSFGVVYTGKQRVVCATCIPSNCQHVKRLLEVIQQCPDEEIPSQLMVFKELPTSVPKQPSVKIRSISHRKIPFQLTEELRDRLKADYSKRFRLHDGVAHLIPPQLSSGCPLCGSNWSTEPRLVNQIFLVTPMCCYPAKGTVHTVTILHML